jgi:hypothetical protein
MATEVPVVEGQTLNPAQADILTGLGYCPLVTKHDTLYQAHSASQAMAEREPNTPVVLTAVFMLYNTMCYELAKRCVPLNRTNVSKGDLVNLLYGGTHTDKQTIDFATPLAWREAMRDLNVDTTWYVWVYPKQGPDRHGGKPLNLAEAWAERMVTA